MRQRNCVFMAENILSDRNMCDCVFVGVLVRVSVSVTATEWGLLF